MTDDPTLGGLLGPRPPAPTLAPPLTLDRMAQDVRDTNCDGCRSCQDRAKAVAQAYLSLRAARS